MHARRLQLCLLLLAVFAVAPAFAAEVVVQRDTRVYLSTKEPLVGKKGELEVGRLVRCEVWRDVLVDGRVVIAAGTPATAKVDTLSYHKVAGIKGKITLAALETETVQRQSLTLTGGYMKEGSGRIALSASLAALVAWPLIFIPGKPAELPVGTVFDAYTLQSTVLSFESSAQVPPAIRIGMSDNASASLSAELLYDKLQGQDKPRVFEFIIRAPATAPNKFVIDTINGERVEPIALTTLSSSKDGDELTVNATASINDLAKQFKRGINTIEIAYGEGASRMGGEVVINIQF